jgi:hypothetical protein
MGAALFSPEKKLFLRGKRFGRIDRVHYRVHYRVQATGGCKL